MLADLWHALSYTEHLCFVGEAPVLAGGLTGSPHYTVFTAVLRASLLWTVDVRPPLSRLGSGEGVLVVYPSPSVLQASVCRLSSLVNLSAGSPFVNIYIQ